MILTQFFHFLLNFYLLRSGAVPGPISKHLMHWAYLRPSLSHLITTWNKVYNLYYFVYKYLEWTGTEVLVVGFTGSNFFIGSDFETGSGFLTGSIFDLVRTRGLRLRLWIFSCNRLVIFWLIFWFSDLTTTLSLRPPSVKLIEFGIFCGLELRLTGASASRRFWAASRSSAAVQEISKI